MKKELYLGKKIISVSDFALFDDGGAEGAIYRLKNGDALKIFRDIDNMNDYQNKLSFFPMQFHPNICFPKELLISKEEGKRKKIIGYSMSLINNSHTLNILGDSEFRKNKRITKDVVISIFKKLHILLTAIHFKGFVIGDFNETNILICDKLNPYIIDTDSFQFDEYKCDVYKPDRIDPLICKASGDLLEKKEDYCYLNDWYSFAEMLFVYLFSIEAYGGAFTGESECRKMERITIFDDRIIFPKNTTHYSHYPEELLIYFYRIFNNDLREPFNISLLENIDWKTCKKCGKEYARKSCPSCNNLSPIINKCKIKSNLLFKTNGKIVFSKVDDNHIKYVYYENGKYFRENKKEILADNSLLDVDIKVDSTFFHKNGKLFEVNKNRIVMEREIDQNNGKGIFCSNSKKTFWIYKGALYRNDVFIKKLKKSNNMLYLGVDFGFMFGFIPGYNGYEAFLFNNLDDTTIDIVIPQIKGQIKGVDSYISKDLLWVFISYKGIDNYLEANQQCFFKLCLVYDKNGKFLARHEEKFESLSWLSIKNKKFAIANLLYSVCDSGLIKLKLEKSKIVIDKLYTNEELSLKPFDNIYLSGNDLFVINEKNLRKLTLI